MGSKRPELPWLIRPMMQREEPSQFSDALRVSPLTTPFSVEGSEMVENVTTPLLDQNNSTHSFRSPSLGRVLISLCIVITIAVLLVQHGWAHSTKEASPVSNRMHNVLECASKLSALRMHRTKPDPIMMKAMEWFLLGAGQEVAVPGSNCDWNTSFGILYTLVIIREALHVTDTSWNTDKPLKDSSDVCKWKRLKCDSNQRIVALTLNHDNITGTIPVELCNGLTNLTRLYLYRNDGLTGMLPSELGNLNRLEEVFVQKTSLTGRRIPSQLGRLSSLQELLLDNTGLTGTMPNEICQLRTGNLHDLRANCKTNGPVQCLRPECCTSCFS